ncbi:FIST N-terminal domain-containing protein [Fuchsiella alkaliacetigena]|uniref:FIST N-terminal domain-containing protein n=1 Tax=Fuchsiella alkaliacetigena TaxID=957042 RepID=UPI00200AB379|nr:FIST N-terminal domain-containing protein [Fuchsiella alkaliacetigena]MCK8823452.1 SpoIIE family protein phosphatase [Fuchsiella alkaliacetigena]
MKVKNICYQNKDNLRKFIKNKQIEDRNLLIQVFTGVCERKYITRVVAELNDLLPQAVVIGSTTAGEIMNGKHQEETTVLSFSNFEKTSLQGAAVCHHGVEDCFELGERLGNKLISENTKAIILFSDWINIDEELIKGIEAVNSEVIIAGGRAADNFRFEDNYIFFNDRILEGGVVGVALNSEKLKVYADYNLGWKLIGKEMEVTKSEGSKVYTIDEQPVYDIYAKYLGEEIAQGLPQVAGPEFPLIIKEEDFSIARGAVAKGEDGSVTFGGHVPEGAKVYLGYGHIDSILANNEQLLKNIIAEIQAQAIYVYSCSVRKDALQDNLDLELGFLEKVAPTAGFFTYGEFYNATSQGAKLLNITLTVLALSECENVKATAKDRLEVAEIELNKGRDSSTIKALTNLANTVTQELESLYSDLEAEFEKGSKLHQQFLPCHDDLPQIEGLAYNTYFQPSAELGGDFYDVVKLGNQLMFYVADVSGHGLDSSMLNIFLRETINNYLLYHHSQGEKLNPGELIGFIAKRYHQENFPADYFICLLMGVLDLKEYKLTFANAGFQVPPLLIKTVRAPISVDVEGMPLNSAISEALFIKLGMMNYQEKEVYLQTGDLVFLTTDGLIEEAVEQKKGKLQYGVERLENLLLQNYCLPPDLINFKVRKDFKSFSGQEKGQDDITFLALKNKLPVIDSFEGSISSCCEEMYQLQNEMSDFIASYYEDDALICIGFQELITNAIEHGNQFDESKQIEIEVEVNKKYIQATIRDEGPGFDWQSKVEEELDIERELEDPQERGRGIKIANKLYDELWYNEQGNEVSFLKFR